MDLESLSRALDRASNALAVAALILLGIIVVAVGASMLALNLLALMSVEEGIGVCSYVMGFVLATITLCTGLAMLYLAPSPSMRRGYGALNAVFIASFLLFLSTSVALPYVAKLPPSIVAKLGNHTGIAVTGFSMLIASMVLLGRRGVLPLVGLGLFVVPAIALSMLLNDVANFLTSYGLSAVDMGSLDRAATTASAMHIDILASYALLQGLSMAPMFVAIALGMDRAFAGSDLEAVKKIHPYAKPLATVLLFIALILGTYAASTLQTTGLEPSAYLSTALASRDPLLYQVLSTIFAVLSMVKLFGWIAMVVALGSGSTALASSILSTVAIVARGSPSAQPLARPVGEEVAVPTALSRKCPFCGRDVPEQASFCPYCGAYLGTDETAVYARGEEERG